MRVGVTDQMSEPTQRSFSVFLAKQLLSSESTPSMRVAALRTLSYVLRTLGELVMARICCCYPPAPAHHHHHHHHHHAELHTLRAGRSLDRHALGACVDYDLPPLGLDVVDSDSSSSSMLPTDDLTFNMEDNFVELDMPSYAKDLLYDAQSRHPIFRDDFVIKAFDEAEKAHRGQWPSLFAALCGDGDASGKHWKEQLENLCFKYLHHDQYQELSSKLVKFFDEAVITSSVEKLEQALNAGAVSYHSLSGRHKSLFGIHSKMSK
ncbi:hypothetical protein OROHE_025006 [Orobanche hederae]